MDARTRKVFARLLVVAVVIGTISTMGGAGADGEGGTSTVTATLTGGAIGSRSVTLAAPVAMSSVLNSATLGGALAVTVSEASRTGTNPWSVTVSSDGITDTASNHIASSNLAISGRSVVQTLGGGTITNPSGSEAFDAARTLFSNAGQSTGSVYTGTYASTSTITLTPPNGAQLGVYTGTLTITLVQ